MSLWSSLLYILIFTYPIYFIVLLCVLFQLIVGALAVEVAKFAAERWGEGQQRQLELEAGAGAGAGAVKETGFDS